MEEKTSRSGVSAQEQTRVDSSTENTEAARQGGPSAEKAGTEVRQAYGSAKTENLRTSGIWRVLIPLLVIALCLLLVAVPLIILIPLLYNSLTAPGNSPLSQLVWLWITMIVLEMGIVALVIWGLYKIFLTQAGNYSR